MKTRNVIYVLFSLLCVIFSLWLIILPQELFAQTPPSTQTLSSEDRVAATVSARLTIIALTAMQTPPTPTPTEKPMSEEDIDASVSATLTAHVPLCTIPISEGDLPTSPSYELIVEPNEFHVWSSGPICVSHDGSQATCIQGGLGRGNITVFLPVNGETTTYDLSRLVPRSNWHGVFANCSDTEQEEWVEVQAYQMTQPGNCGLPAGCARVEITTFIGEDYEQITYDP